MMDCPICHKPMSGAQGIFIVVVNFNKVEQCCLDCYNESMRTVWRPPVPQPAQP